nr:N-6 DNA methylase [Halobaculum sp. YSMS11]
MLDVLGFDTIQETSLPETNGYIDRVLFDSPEDRRDAMMMQQDGMVSGTFGKASALLEAKRWGASFEKTFSEQRQYRDASHQVKYYLERTPDSLRWGVLTNGRKWRLYGIKDYETQTYYEVDLPELLESGSVEAFKYFYVFFRSAAFREVSGTSFLDTVWNESETAAQELGEDLQDNVFTALRVLGEGFVESNDLDIGDDDAAVTEEELKEHSLVLLYRLMFVLYAESRGLISPDDPARRAEYDEHFSLDELRREIHEEVNSGQTFDEYSTYSTSMWSRLEDLFRLVDSGEESLGIPPYNGGLFDRDEHAFLADHEVSDRYLAEVVYRLGTTQADNGEGFVLADYADLDTRHLGTIYEGLLEHEFRIAPEEYAAVSEDGGQVWKPATEVSVADAVETVEAGELYVVNDDGERKATGAYYTPDYVVTYIVEETVDPLIEEIDADLADRGIEAGTQEYVFRFADEVLDLTVLDPAMGSGHFLTKATGYLAERVMERAREVESTAGVLDEQDIRRRVSRECIYGVDINDMAVELAKLSMWLETLAEEKPLAFLDHHLKAGNSLVGSDISEVLSEDEEESADGQMTLFEAVAHARQRTLEHVMELMGDLLAIDNDDYADIKSMEELYAEIRDDPLYSRLFELANVHTAERFGLDVPEGVYEEMAGAIESEAEWSEVRENDWFRSAQTMAKEEDFFHWELEYPEVFFDRDGEKLGDDGFDAVVGNPPWGQPISGKDYLKTRYSKVVKRLPDSFAYFSYLSQKLAKQSSTFGMIVPNASLFQSEYSKLRYELTSNGLTKVIDLGEGVFKGVVAPAAIIIADRNNLGESIQISNLRQQSEIPDSDKLKFLLYPRSNVLSDEGHTIPTYKAEVSKLRLDTLKHNTQFGKKFDVNQGVQTGGDDIFTVTSPDVSKHNLESEYVKPTIFGSDLKPYLIGGREQYVLYINRNTNKKNIKNILEYLEQYREELESNSEVSKGIRPWYSLHRPRNPELFEQDKVLLRQTGDTLKCALDTEHYFNIHSLLCLAYKENATQQVGLGAVACILNSTLLREFYDSITQERGRVFAEVKPQNINKLPFPNTEAVESSILSDDVLSTAAGDQKLEGSLSKASESKYSLVAALENLYPVRSDIVQSQDSLNLSLLDHLGTFSDGDTLSDIGLPQPPQNAADSVLQETTEQKPNLRVGHAEVARESTTTVEIRLTARYKPDDEDAHETDRWGYTETDPLPALRITDLTETEADLIEHFVPVAVDEAGGFAGFRETATKTNSLVDRLRALTLPAVGDVRDGLESYIETKERAEELEEQIERTDDLIDEIVYELYGLSDEEIEIVEEAVRE